MPRLTKTERLTKIHEASLKDFNKSWTAQRYERKQSLFDRRFYSIPGAQWEGPLAEQFTNKPKMEVNKIHLAVIRIISEYRNNRITVDFISKDEASNDEMSDICDGLYRADEQDSSAQEAYDNAFEEAIGGGFGAYRLRACYEDEEDDENDYQRIRIEPIYDADTCVFFDLDAKRQDKSDAKKCWVLTSMSRDAFEEEYGDDPSSWPKSEEGVSFDWASSDIVWVAEYYEVEMVPHTVYTWQDLQGVVEKYTNKEFEDDPDLRNRLLAMGGKEIKSKKTKKKRVHKYIMSGADILEDCGHIAGCNIPIVPMYGKRWYVDNVERCMGHVRLAIDAQRLKNMQVSKLAYISAKSSDEKPIFTPEQIAGFREMWENDNVKDYPYLLVNPMVGPDGSILPSGPVAYTKPPDVPPTLAALLQITDQDIKEILGSQEQGEQVQPNISGKVVELVQQRLDMQTFIYVDNAKKSIKRGGEIWLSMVKDIMVEEGRKVKALNDQNKPYYIELMKPMKDEPTGKTVIQNDFTKVKLDVVADVGPSTESKRSATVKALTAVSAITDDPETKNVINAAIMMNMEGEGLGDIRQWFRKKLILAGVVKPTAKESEEIKEEQSGTPRDPNAVYLESAAKAEDARAAKANADTVAAVAEADKTRAETAKIASEVDMNKLNHAIQILKDLGFLQDLTQVQQ